MLKDKMRGGGIFVVVYVRLSSAYEYVHVTSHMRPWQPLRFSSPLELRESLPGMHGQEMDEI